MTYEQISALLSLLAAIVITVVNFYPWYSTTYDGAPKVKIWGKIILFLCIALITSSAIFLFYPKNDDNDNTAQEDKEVLQDFNQASNVKLIYNNSTGELYPTLPEGLSVHSCVWTIWGDHGSDTVVVTKESDMYAMKSSDYIGHFLSNDIEIIKEYNFLPPRVPIYVSCVDWKNNVYSGSIGEYDF